MRGEWLFPGAASPTLYSELGRLSRSPRIAKLKNHRGEHEERETNMKRANIIQILLGIVLVGVVPAIRAVVPPPDGGYPGGNTAEGQNALLSLTTGGFNTAVGFLSLRSDKTGSFNTAIGAGTLLANTGDSNSATGAGALLSNTTGTTNTSNGAFALFSNTEANQNTAMGFQALFNNTGSFSGSNTATG
jgi:hypothetical protein